MKVIIYMSMTANGYIARRDGNTKFILGASDRDFRKVMSKARANLVGAGTYRKTLANGNFPYKGLNVVMTRKPIKSRWKNVIFTDKGPEKALKFFEEAGCRTVMVGGGRMNSLFMRKGLVDELYINIEPSIFTDGIRIFDGQDFEAKLKLVGARRLSKNEMQLHYKVLR
ncbi:MAG: dihydrofolate reductase family protein [Candidatus Micrarchaeota archaeon]|nr:dihydrofolate reductase family protein [Candidatus Micrarchaeota archaeon]MDE1849786.1 dihydrofolate reductase family protein [Candidatus Micrarchaeota archaeon]